MARYIDADVLCKVLEKRADDEWNKRALAGTWSEVYQAMIDTIDDEPTADVELVKHEHWFNDGEDKRCSGCRAIIEIDEWLNHNWNFCYHCGARMDGDDND